MGSVREEIAKNLLYYRKVNKITQKQLATYLGVNSSAVSNWENGVNSIDIDTLNKVCIFFKVSMNDMFGVYANTKQSYSSDERILIDNFRLLNLNGQDYVIKQLTFALSQDEYKKDYNVQKNCLA